MRQIGHFLDNQIAEKADLIDKLNAVVLPILPEQCRPHVTASNFSNQELTLIADSPVWAARLRTQQRLICSELSEKLNLPVKTIKIRFNQPRFSPKKENPHQHLSLSQQSAKIIAQTAATIDDDALKQALLRLTSHCDQ